VKKDKNPDMIDTLPIQYKENVQVLDKKQKENSVLHFR
jgi:hypothetical protein